MPGRVTLHVGTHRTGTSSIQLFLREHNDGLLAAVGCHYPDGFLLPIVHTDLPLLTVRRERMWPARIRFPETQHPGWQADAARHVRSQVEDPTREHLVYLHEDLSYLRHDDELEALRSLLDGRSVSVVVFLRDRESFRRSYRSQLEGTGFELSDDPTSFAYLEPDSWILQYDDLVDGYRRWFGEDNVRVFDYDAISSEGGGVIPAFAEVLGIHREALPDLGRYRLNPTGSHIRLSEAELGAIRRRLAAQYT